MIYAYKCRSCGQRIDSHERADMLGGCSTPACPGIFTRDYSGLQFAGVMQEHYNTTTNSGISSNKQFDDQMRRMSDQRSEELGMEHKFERVDPSDKKALGVTDEGMDSTNRQRAKDGLPTYKL